MACPKIEKLCYVAGDTITINMAYTDKPGAPVPLTGASAAMQLLNAITDEFQVIDMSGGIIDAANGLMKFTLTKVQSQGLLPVGTGENSPKIDFTSRVKLTFLDTTTKTIVGFDVTIEQGGNR